MKRHLETPLNTQIEDCTNWKQILDSSSQVSTQERDALTSSSKRRKRENRCRNSEVYRGNTMDEIRGSSRTCQRRSTKRKRFFEGSSAMNTQRVNRERRKKPRREVLPAAIIGQPLPEGPLKLGNIHYCLHCNAKKFKYETLHFCCCNGEVKIATNEFPDELCRLFTSQEEDVRHFKQYSRMYNNLFAYSSIGGKTESSTYKGIYVFKMHGQIYHSVPDLLPNGNQPKFLQLYFYDGQHEVQNRVKCFPQVREDIVRILMKVSEKNPYARFFRSLRELKIDENTQIILNQSTVLDQRVYNAPLSDEVAVVWPDSISSNQITTPHVLVYGKSAEPHRICHYYGCYDPIQYPLLFPHGECGWTQNLKKQVTVGTCQTRQVADPINSCAVHTIQDFLDEEATRAIQRRTRADKYISPREYYAYKLQIRPHNMLLRAGRCFQQFIVDMYVKIENTRLDFLRNNQDTIRADLYQGILDSVTSGETDASKIGHLVILPPSFTGCPRDLRRRYLNAMALVQRYGKPDLFITMTCNANWPEIKAELQPGEKARDKPNIVAQIFRAKLLALKKQIMKKNVLGEVAAMIYVVEFQKRGLPHAHFLIILKSNFKIRGPTDYDKFVSAEIPSFDNPLLRMVVLTHMMHGPCGKLNPKCPCMQMNGKKLACKNGYPKEYVAETSNNKDGYPRYRRRETGEKVKIRTAQLDNRWVVPYNPYLLLMFDCHLNVEVCSTIKAVKYLYKYVYKGHDRISYKISATNDNKVDEIEQFQSGRWVSPCEAAWRIFGFDLYEIYPPVMPLPVHLPNMQSIAVRPHENLNFVVRDPKRSRTPLTEYFSMNAKTYDGTGLLYGEFPEHYRWDARTKTWIQRQKKLNVIGRMTFVLPAEGERFFLRLLLLNVRNAGSFLDLRTVENYVCATFQETAQRLGLLEDDDAASMLSRSF